jgi:hypothetical protein
VIDLPVMPDEYRPGGIETPSMSTGAHDAPRCEKHAGKGVSTDPEDLLPKATVEEIRAALSVIPANCTEDVWYRIGAALYDHFGGSEEGFKIFHEWSATGGDKYKGERDCRNKWVNSAKKKEIHIATVFHYADQNDASWRGAHFKSSREDLKPEPEAEAEAKDEAEDEAEDEEPPTKSPIPLFWPGEEAAEEARWRVKGLIPEVGVGILSARRGAGKTFVAIDLAYTLARLKTYIGKPIVANTGTLWIAKESPGQIPLRLRGLPEEPGKWPLRYVKTCPPLLDGKSRANARSIDDIIAAINVASEEMIARFEMPVGLVAIDTMRRAAGYGDRGENDPSITGNVMQALSDIAEETRSFVLGIDHMGHDTSRGTRGGTSKEDDSDLVLYLDGEHGKGVVVVEKVRDGVDGIAVDYECVTVEIGLDKDGDPVTTCRVELGDPKQAERAERTSKMTKLLESVIKELGDLPRPREEVREAFKKRHGGHGEAADKAFKRAIDKLGLVEAGDSLYPKGSDFM